MAPGGLAFFVINRINSADPNYEPKYLLLFTDAKVRYFFLWPTKKIPSNMNFISICRFAMICIEKAKTTVYNDTKIPNCRCNSGYIWVILFNTIYL